MYRIAAGGNPVMEWNALNHVNVAHKLAMILSLLIIGIIFQMVS